MQLAISALGSLASKALVGGKALLGAASGVAGGSSTTLSVLQGVATAASVVSTLAAGRQQAESSELQAGAAELDAQREQTAGVRRTTALKRELLKVLGDNDVAYAAAGIDISTGAAADARGAAEKRAAQEITIDRSETDARRAALKARAAGYRRISKSQRRGALIGAIGQGAQYGISLAKRG